MASILSAAAKACDMPASSRSESGAPGSPGEMPVRLTVLAGEGCLGQVGRQNAVLACVGGAPRVLGIDIMLLRLCRDVVSL